MSPETRTPAQVSGVAVQAESVPGGDTVLSDGALAFVRDLTRAFQPRLDELLARRTAPHRLDFLDETAAIREGDWVIAPVPEALQRRMVEITGPVDRKMIINALNSGADVFMADFEDSTSPTWPNLLSGQANLIDAVLGRITHLDSASGKSYQLNQTVARLFVRPRGLHLPERHLTVDGRPVPGSFVDFGLFFYHNASALLDRGAGPWFYLPKLEDHLEARLWNDVFLHAQAALGIPKGTIKATVLIETLPAAFQMDEILYELREHSAGLNCGRWDYIFSMIKTRRQERGAVLPDRSQITMTQPCMRAYTQLVVRTCHRRGAHAIGGMAAQIPIRDDPAASAQALDKVRADKLREVGDGHDGTWVAHPGLVPVAREVFAAHMTGPHQLHRLREDVRVTGADLLQIPEGTRTEEGLRLNARVGIQYLAAWLQGQGCVPLYHLMEDAATAEISRTQVWQWIHHGAGLADGRPVTAALLREIVTEEMDRISREAGPARVAAGRYAEACELFVRLSTDVQCAEFLTLAAYELL
jgi:malate synthase